MINNNFLTEPNGKKPWYKSKTIWFNVVTIALGFIQVIGDTYVIPTEWMAWIVGFGNLVLRAVTDTKITARK